MSDDAQRIDWSWNWSDVIPPWLVPALLIAALVIVLFGLLIFRFVKEEELYRDIIDL
jgi:hypothetical protein